MFRFFKDLRIQSKIVAFYLPLVLLPLIVLGFIVNYLFSDRLLKQTIQNVSDNSELVIQQIEKTIGDGANCANMLTIQLSKTILAVDQEPYGYLSLTNAINGQISWASVVFPEVESMAFVAMDQTIYSPNVWIQSNRKSLEFDDMMKRIAKTNGINIWLPLEPRTLMVADPGQIYLTLGKKVFDIQTGRQLGSLVLSIKETSFSKIFKSLQKNENRTYYVIDQWQRVVSSSKDGVKMKRLKDPEIVRWLTGQRSFNRIMVFEGEQMLITCRPFKVMDWQLVTATPISAIYSEIWSTGKWIFGITVIVAMLAIWMSQVLSEHLARPIKSLKKAMQDIESGQWHTTLKTDSQDEIGSLTRSFAKMRARIIDLLKRVNEEESQKRHYELALISAQIKPHFLYNTLDTIYVLAQMKRMELVSEATKSLADFYRVALSGGNEEISLKSEIKSVEDYLKIQKIRYSDIFDYEIDLPEALESCRVLKMTLQPLVENAIYHGLKEKRAFGHLRVWVVSEADHLLLYVSDDGLGMSQERVSEIMKESSAGIDNHFGLFSVHRRIMLQYGSAYGLHIMSQQHEGTTICVKVPNKQS